jgi:stage II sporulation protein E
MISDGMGSGRRAAGESAAAVSFLTKLLTSGFEVDVAVKTVNALLLLHTPEESFATVDIAVIDTFAGEAEFLKVGSAPSFVKRVREVATIKSSSLPMGILQQIEIEPVKWLLASGDVIVMVSDGVVEVPYRGPERENWMVNFLRRIGDGTPQEMADSVLRQAVDMAGASIRDDMTVLVAKVTERPGLG